MYQANEHDTRRSPHMDHRSATLHRDQFMALLVHQEFAVDAFVALSSQTPDTVCTDGTVGSLMERNTHTHYIPGDATEAVMASETCSPARSTIKFYQSHRSVSPPSSSLHQSIQRQAVGMCHSSLSTHIVAKL